MSQADDTPYLYNRWDRLAGLCLANLLGFFCFYIPVVLYVESSQPLVSKFPDLAAVGSVVSFVVGYLARPLGAVFFGLIGDGHGLRRTYFLSSLLLILTTVGLGMLPSLTALGAGALFISYVLRLLQGFAIGGAYCVTSLLAYDLAPRTAKSRFTNFIQLSSPAGYLSAIALVILLKLSLGDNTFARWGWQICFFFALFLLYYTYRIGISHTFEQRQPRDVSLKQLWFEMVHWLRDNPEHSRRFWFFILPLSAATCLNVYVGNIYQLYFFQNMLGIEPTLAKFILAISSLIFLVACIMWGYLADRYGYMKVMILGLYASLICVLPSYMLMEKLSMVMRTEARTVGYCSAAIILLAAFVGIVTASAYCPLITFLGDNLPKQNRTTFFAICYNIGFGLFGICAHAAGTYGIRLGTIYGSIYFSMAIIPIALIIVRLYERTQGAHTKRA